MVTKADAPAAPQPGGGVDFLVSYIETDEEWAAWIAWQLEEAGFRVRFEAWDLSVGMHRTGEQHRALVEAKRIVAVVSASYLASKRKAPEWQAALAESLPGDRPKLLPIRVEDFSLQGLLLDRVSADLFGIDETTARERLLAAVHGAKKPEYVPAFPGKPDIGVGRKAPYFPGQYQERGSAWPPGRSPFPGLAAFDASLAAVFRGRDADIRRLVDTLTSPAGDSTGLVAVVGQSGCGKSSLVAAGLVPTVTEDPYHWLVVPSLAPGNRPLVALADALAEVARDHGLNWDRKQLTSQLTEPGAIAEVTRELLAAARPAPRLLIVIDQAEELLVRASPNSRKEFLAVLAAASAGLVRVVATVRSEYLGRLVEEAAQVGLPVRTEAILPLTQEMLRLVVSEPARLAGLTIDDQLVARLVTDTGDGQALPLLAFILQRLYVQACRAGTTTLSDVLYETTGGVRSALIEHANVALDKAATATGRSRDEVLDGLLQLVSVDTDGRPTRHRLPLDGLNDRIHSTLAPFIAHRLLTVDAAPGGPATIDIAHERLLADWSSLATAIDQRSDQLRLRSQADTAAADWDYYGRPLKRLWSLPLAGEALATFNSDDLTPITHAFLIDSCRQGRRVRTRNWTVVVGLLVVLIVLAVYGLQMRDTAEERDRARIADQLLVRADSIRVKDPALALRLVVAAYDVGPRSHRDRIRGNLLGILADTPTLRTTITGHSSQVWVTAFGLDGILASAANDGTVLLWDVADGVNPRQVGSFSTGDAGLTAMTFSLNGLIATVGENGAQLWDVTDPDNPQQLDASFIGSADDLVFGPGGVLAAVNGKTVQLWDVTDPASPQRGGSLTGHTDDVSTLVFGPNGIIATASWDTTVRLWDATDPNHPYQRGEPLTTTYGSSVTSVTFGPNGILASASDDGTVRLWDVSDLDSSHQVGGSLTGHTNADAKVAFGSDGLLATADERTVQLWDVSDPINPHQVGKPLAGHTDSISWLTFGPDGLLATASWDTTVRLWDVSSLRQLRADVVETACQRAGGGLNEKEWDRYLSNVPYRNTCGPVHDGSK
ncbi:TIR domain-containing protein [Parafrankia sp. CH37]|uniref:nSTAND1 domain-containing NTPase n=1 Tax=Parafrankia sp. CH37 TaxID=683308 RepID=UPI000B872324|nr:TIR domain-containing protein [Parafrankia sp. CH37]MBE3204863.1 TIR domain-containing protein [Parafrankia sp. CH37]